MPKKKINPKVGDVFQIALPDGRYAYGRVYRDSAAGIYQETTDRPNRPPIGSRKFRFIVGSYREFLERGICPIVGHDPFVPNEDEFPPPSCLIDPITGGASIYHRGTIRPAKSEECIGLEITAGWDLNHLIDRVMNGNASKFLVSMRKRTW